ncbi:Oidioi.mRNA.OKI2018_I69.chr2.g5938.t1.cds [Oikopleura dioica]|uniref:Oidioi.mRNA.OKI2018_I69.chr2.g5938.t1.cds n=1 Tax=Oikopleura dioica TaxID=34765 RepID=A0ABN7T3M9_OIKDI|nr:Oidioi.mRNA.OKI2018_I69.chr2.g5938.t1.cds [Oikopleura dioica]
MPKERKKKGARKNNDPLIKKPKPLGQEPVEHMGDGVLIKDVDPSKIGQSIGQSGPNFVDPKITRGILEAAREQQKEENPIGLDDEDEFPALGAITAKNPLEDDDDEEYEDIDEEGEDVEEVVIDGDDEEALAMFSKGGERQNLADLIMAKIEAKKQDVQEIVGEDEVGSNLPEELVIHYQQIGNALANYRSGKMPKSFKLIPRLTNWEDILDVMAPEKWSAAAMYQATRMFASNMSEGLVQRFYNVYLLPRIRDDIEFYKKLNFHLMSALKKAIYKPAAFFKGILLPLAMAADTCTLREATIICSCLREHSIPVMPAAAAMLKIAEMEYNGVNSLFLRTLIEKKYALPFRVMDALVFHFLRFKNEKRVLPVLWHQCFLSFVSIYAADISAEQKEALMELTKFQNHPKIVNEIRHQIQRTEPRDIEMEQPPEHILEEMMMAN